MVDDGYGPLGRLLYVNGTLYGTTVSGGAYATSGLAGTVFSLNAAGAEHVLHSFGKGTDGSNPWAGLVNVNGTLYGTTTGGGIYGRHHGTFTAGYGTVYEVSTAGTERVLHSFGRGTDGQTPYAGLIDVNGTLYGTTYSGGMHGFGTVFSITRSGEERVLHSFSGPPDGALPFAALIVLNGTLYGTTSAGGIANPPNTLGGGTVFSVSRSGNERVLHAFGKRRDGLNPGTLVSVNGTLYGITGTGGKYGSYITGGTVYSTDTLGNERVLHRFGGHDATPGDLIEVNGTLYGTANNAGLHAAGGIIFRTSLTGATRVLYQFGGGADGSLPVSLRNVNGVLYGTSSKGGAHNAGTVFSIDLATGAEKVVYSFNPGQ